MGYWQKTGSRTYELNYTGPDVGPAGEKVDNLEQWREVWRILSLNRKEIEIKLSSDRNTGSGFIPKVSIIKLFRCRDKHWYK